MQLHPADEAAARYHIGNQLLEDGEYTEALGYLEEAANLNSGEAEYWNLLGHCQNQLHMHRDALQSLKRAVALDPGLSAGYYNLAVTLMNLNVPDEAIQHAWKALEIAKFEKDVIGTEEAQKLFSALKFKLAHLHKRSIIPGV